MTASRLPLTGDRNLKWSELRSDSGAFATIADCAQHCLPALRACAALFLGSQAGGDDLVEGFLLDLLRQEAPEPDLHTPAGLTLAFQQFLRSQFGEQPQRVTLSSTPSVPSGVWMTVDAFFETIAQL